MRNQEQLIKKKPKRRRRFVRFIFMLILFIIVLSLVFYNIENPAFIGNTIERFKSFYLSSSQVDDMAPGVLQNDIKSDEELALEFEEGLNKGSEENNNQEDLNQQEGTGVDDTGQQDTSGIISSGADESLKADNNVQDNSAVQILWQKILNFFKRGMEKDNKNFPSSLELKVYFASLGEDVKFSYEKRKIVAGNPKIAVENAVKEMLDGPYKSFNFPVVPPGTKLRDVEIYENLAKINLSQEFLDNSLESGILDKYVIYTIVNTVTQVPGVDGVIFLIEGKRIKIYGNIDLSIPAIRNEDFLDKDDPADEYIEESTT